METIRKRITKPPVISFKRYLRVRVFGCMLAIILLIVIIGFGSLGDSAGDLEYGVDIPTKKEVEEIEDSRLNIFDRSEYGMILKYEDEVVSENFTMAKNEEIEVIDCRKMSANLREGLLKSGDNECYQVKVLFDTGYIVIRTGDGVYVDPVENNIPNPDNMAFKLFPESKINLPLVRKTISEFPTNLSGTKTSYASGEDYTFYKGVVYRGADKYSVTISGEVDSHVSDFLEIMYLD